MNYPIWELFTIGGGSLIAFISILHVYVAHLAVGGGLFIWLTDRKGVKENNRAITDYVQRHTWFFLLLTMVFGGVSGVGIWFIIALVQPSATSLLIHNFVFAWAIEWVFFGGEIVALLVYHYRFRKMSEKSRLKIAFLYFIFAWLSLVVINGILSFMLTPGKWLETQNFWDGFLNPTYFSSTFFRTFMAAMIAGLFGYVTSAFLKEGNFRNQMMKYCTKWLLYPLPLLMLSAVWYFYSIPENVRYTAFHLNPQSELFILIFVISSLLIFVLSVLLALKLRASLQKGLTFVLIFIGLSWMGGYEYSREIARKPYIIYDYMYSNSILKADVEKINKAGILSTAKWSAVKSITESNRFEAGREIFNLQCLSCHTINGIRNDIIEKSEGNTYLGMVSLLTGQGKMQNYMPPFVGTQQEKEALAEYIIHHLMGKNIESEPQRNIKNKAEVEIPPFDEKRDEYVLLVWSSFGTYSISDNDKWFSISPPANTLEAQLIKRGETPELISEGVTLVYEVEEGFENPAKQIDFWKYSEQNYGKKLQKNVGLFGNGLKGKFEFNEDLDSYIAKGIPVVPYKDDGTYHPYPYITVKAIDEETSEILMTTRVVAPAAAEMGCGNCHEGGRQVHNLTGITDETSVNILAVHDRINGTNLLAEAKAGKPKRCQSCHAGYRFDSMGDSTLVNFSAAMHGWHANYMPYDDARACVLCHSASGAESTHFNRGIHNKVGLTCTECHGAMQEHSMALLKAESGKTAAQRMLQNLSPTQVKTIEDINPRIPWRQAPDCLTCHVDYDKPEKGYSGFNVWNDEFSELYRRRTDEVGLRCQACHGTAHALYPSAKNRDMIQPLQYTGKPTPIGSDFKCETCHTVKMEDSAHHENMEHFFRNSSVLN
jgi:cytochrome bd-type quinol oxidase subunit 1